MNKMVFSFLSLSSALLFFYPLLLLLLRERELNFDTRISLSSVVIIQFDFL